MRISGRLVVVWAALVVTAGLMVSGPSVATPDTVSGTTERAARLGTEAPFWMTPRIQRRISAAGTDGVTLERIQRWVDQGLAGADKQDETVTEPCPTADAYRTTEPTVKAGACQVAPFGCTANFVYYNGPEEAMPPTSDGRHHFIGTAGHCVEHANQPVFMQITAAGVVAKVGEVKKILAGDIGTNGFGNGGIGNDFAAIRVYEGLTVDPASPAGGPQGIYTACDPQPVKYYGHGFGVAVGQGKIEGGVATNWFEREFAWTGVALPGDSGSGVVLATGEAAGDLTHLVVDLGRYPGSDTAGTRMTRILSYLRGDYYLVNADRTTSRATRSDTTCGPSNNGGPALPVTLPLP